MKTTGSNHFKAAIGGKEIFLSRPNYLATLGVVLVIFLNKIIQIVMSFTWNFAFFFNVLCVDSVYGAARALLNIVSLSLHLLFKHSLSSQQSLSASLWQKDQ